MNQRTHIIHTAQLKNNCPTCYGNDGMEFTFTQDEKENALWNKPDAVIKEILYCHNCKTTIYPVNWTDDIELVYEYNKKLAETHRHHLRVKPLAYILLFGSVIVIAALVYFLLNSSSIL